MAGHIGPRGDEAKPTSASALGSRPMTARARRALAVVAVLLCGCPATPTLDGGAGGGGGGAATGGGGGTATTSLEDYCTAREGALCDAQVRCGAYATASGCGDAFEEQRVQWRLDDCSVGRASVADGRQRFDGAAAASCLSGLATAACRAPSTCGDVFAPRVTQGGACFDDRDCVMGTFCDTRTVCPGTCQPRVPADTRFDPGERCLEGLYSEFRLPSDGGFTVEYFCRAPAAASQPCDPAFFFSCVTGLACSPASRTCVSAKPAGEPCEFFDGGFTGGQWANVCSSGLYCQPVADGGAPRCGAPAAVGEACGTCQFDLFCADDGGCATKGLAGAACALPSHCAWGFFCLPTGSAPLGPGTCQPRLDAGATCRGSTDCQPGLACDAFPASDGGSVPELRCAAGDGGVAGLCLDLTP